MQDKIEEAKFFYTHMQSVTENRKHVNYYLSTFLTAARSPIQYAYESVRGTGKQKWYDDWIKDNRYANHFKVFRDDNCHTEPERPKINSNVTLDESVLIKEEVFVKLIRDGKLLYEDKVKPTKEEKPHQCGKSNATVSEKYYLNRWVGSEDLFEVCKKYLDSLNQFIEEGKEKKIF